MLDGNMINCWSTSPKDWEKFDNIPEDASEFEGHTYINTQ